MNTIYNAALERITKRFPDGNMVPLRQAAKYLGVDYRTLEKEFKYFDYIAWEQEA